MKEQPHLASRIAKRAFGRVMLWFCPELSYFADADDRWAALFVVDQSLPKWKRRVKFAIWAAVVICGAFIGATFGMLFIQQFNIQQKRLSDIITLFGLAGGFGIALALFLGMDAFLLRPRLREFLHNIGKATCPSCGYSLAGHVNFKDMRCPECGEPIELTT